MKSIRLISSFWGGTVSMLMILLMLSLTACSSNPKVSEGSTYLEVKAEQVQLNLYKSQMTGLRSKLTEVPPELLTTAKEPPPLLLSKLYAFLEANDCTDPQLSPKSKEGCYRVTRVLLINATRKLDETNTELYVGQRTVTQLVQTITDLVEALPSNTGK